jgi:DNA-binding NtrC family response regulator
LIRDGCLLIPPLRERPEDVPLLAHQYVLTIHGSRPVRIEEAAVARLTSYHWPGNVRQLQTVLRIALRMQPDVLEVNAVDEALRRFEKAPAPPCAPGAGLGLVAEAGATPPADTAAGSQTDFHAITARTQRQLLLAAFETAAGNKTAAGVLLGFHRSPGEERPSDQPLTDARRNLALRKFRYWCGRLGLAEALAGRRASVAFSPRRP